MICDHVVKHSRYEQMNIVQKVQHGKHSKLIDREEMGIDLLPLRAFLLQ